MNDESYIKLSLELAKKGSGKVSPNPLVGSIIVKGDKIVGAGFHERFGGKHAEINAIEACKESLEGATLFSNLEPCSHFGKTPPCVDRIIKEKIKRVVIGTLDPNPLVGGKGIKKLKDAGIEVKVGVLPEACIQLNKFFFKFVNKNLPYVTLKAAQTIDGKIADAGGFSNWISSVPSRNYVHQLRASYDGVLIGSGTVERDDPKLTVRLVEGRNPKRIVLDTNLKLNLHHKIFAGNRDKNLILITSRASAKKHKKLYQLKSKGVRIIFVRKKKNGLLDLKDVLSELAELNITSILVEGGSRVFTSFIKEDLFDEMLLFVSPSILGNGIQIIGNLGIKRLNRAVKLEIKSAEKIGDDCLIELIKN